VSWEQRRHIWATALQGSLLRGEGVRIQEWDDVDVDPE
jgi:hypothetical protein